MNNNTHKEPGRFNPFASSSPRIRSPRMNPTPVNQSANESDQHPVQSIPPLQLSQNHESAPGSSKQTIQSPTLSASKPQINSKLIFPFHMDASRYTSMSAPLSPTTSKTPMKPQFGFNRAPISTGPVQNADQASSTAPSSPKGSNPFQRAPTTQEPSSPTPSSSRVYKSHIKPYIPLSSGHHAPMDLKESTSLKGPVAPVSPRSPSLQRSTYRPMSPLHLPAAVQPVAQPPAQPPSLPPAQPIAQPPAQPPVQPPSLPPVQPPTQSPSFPPSLPPTLPPLTLPPTAPEETTADSIFSKPASSILESQETTQTEQNSSDQQALNFFASTTVPHPPVESQPKSEPSPVSPPMETKPVEPVTPSPKPSSTRKPFIPQGVHPLQPTIPPLQPAIPIQQSMTTPAPTEEPVVTEPPAAPLSKKPLFPKNFKPFPTTTPTVPTTIPTPLQPGANPFLSSATRHNSVDYSKLSEYEERLLPKPVLSFGFPGRLVLCTPIYSQSHNLIGSPYIAGQPEIKSVASLLTESLFYKNIRTFPGPLINKNKTSEVKQFITMMIEQTKSLSSWNALWRLLMIFIESNGVVARERTESTKNKIIELLLSLSDLTLESPPNDPLLYTKTEETEYISILIQAQDYILKGKTEEAIKLCIDHQLWSYALAFSSIQRDTFMDTFMKFINIAFPKNNSLSLLLPLLMNNSKLYRILLYTEEYSTITEECIPVWNRILVGLISYIDNENNISLINQLGDLLIQHNRVCEAHICYILSGCELQSCSTGPQFTLLGCQCGPGYPPPHEVCEWATEIYEYGLTLNNPLYKCKSLLPHKLTYLMRLMDMGMIDIAQEYIENMHYILSSSNSATISNGFINQFNLIEQRLKNYTLLMENEGTLQVSPLPSSSSPLPDVNEQKKGSNIFSKFFSAVGNGIQNVVSSVTEEEEPVKETVPTPEETTVNPLPPQFAPSLKPLPQQPVDLQPITPITGIPKDSFSPFVAPPSLAPLHPQKSPKSFKSYRPSGSLHPQLGNTTAMIPPVVGVPTEEKKEEVIPPVLTQPLKEEVPPVDEHPKEELPPITPPIVTEPPKEEILPPVVAEPPKEEIPPVVEPPKEEVPPPMAPPMAPPMTPPMNPSLAPPPMAPPLAPLHPQKKSLKPFKPYRPPSSFHPQFGSSIASIPLITTSTEEKKEEVIPPVAEPPKEELPPVVEPPKSEVPPMIVPPITEPPKEELPPMIPPVVVEPPKEELPPVVTEPPKEEVPLMVTPPMTPPMVPSHPQKKPLKPFKPYRPPTSFHPQFGSSITSIPPIVGVPTEEKNEEVIPPVAVEPPKEELPPVVTEPPKEELPPITPPIVTELPKEETLLTPPMVTPPIVTEPPKEEIPPVVTELPKEAIPPVAEPSKEELPPMIPPITTEPPKEELPPVVEPPKEEVPPPMTPPMTPPMVSTHPQKKPLKPFKPYRPPTSFHPQFGHPLTSIPPIVGAPTEEKNEEVIPPVAVEPSKEEVPPIITEPPKEELPPITPPIIEPPKEEIPLITPPITEPPKEEIPPVVEPPKEELPPVVTEPSKEELPPMTPPITTEPPKEELPPVVEPPKEEVPPPITPPMTPPMVSTHPQKKPLRSFKPYRPPTSFHPQFGSSIPPIVGAPTEEKKEEIPPAPLTEPPKEEIPPVAEPPKEELPPLTEPPKEELPPLNEPPKDIAPPLLAPPSTAFNTISHDKPRSRPIRTRHTYIPSHSLFPSTTVPKTEESTPSTSTTILEESTNVEEDKNTSSSSSIPPPPITTTEVNPSLPPENGEASITPLVQLDESILSSPLSLQQETSPSNEQSQPTESTPNEDTTFPSPTPLNPRHLRQSLSTNALSIYAKPPSFGPAPKPASPLPMFPPQPNSMFTGIPPEAIKEAQEHSQEEERLFSQDLPSEPTTTMKSVEPEEQQVHPLVESASAPPPASMEESHPTTSQNHVPVFTFTTSTPVLKKSLSSSSLRSPLVEPQSDFSLHHPTSKEEEESSTTQENVSETPSTEPAAKQVEKQKKRYYDDEDEELDKKLKKNTPRPAETSSTSTKKSVSWWKRLFGHEEQEKKVYVVNLPKDEQTAYYDEATKKWVFPEDKQNETTPAQTSPPAPPMTPQNPTPSLGLSNHLSSPSLGKEMNETGITSPSSFASSAPPLSPSPIPSPPVIHHPMASTQVKPSITVQDEQEQEEEQSHEAPSLPPMGLAPSPFGATTMMTPAAPRPKLPNSKTRYRNVRRAPPTRNMYVNTFSNSL